MISGFVLGVDFGTSNTAAVLRVPTGDVRPLLFDGVPQLPSAVFVAGTIRRAGRDALHHGLAQPAGLEPNPELPRREPAADHADGRRQGG